MALLLSLIYSNCYYILLLAAAFNSSSVAVMGGVAAHAGYVDFALGIAILTVGASIFNLAYFYLGKRLGGFFNKDKLKQSRFQKIIKLIRKYQVGFIFIYRFLPGFCIISPFALGATLPISYLKFFFLNLIASFIWSSIFFSIGFIFGAVTKHTFSNVSHYENIAFVIVIAVVLISALVRRFLDKRNKPL